MSICRPEVTLDCGEDEIAGMKRLMAEVQLSLFVTQVQVRRDQCVHFYFFQVMGLEDAGDSVCQIKHVAAKWWRPNFEAYIVCHFPRFFHCEMKFTSVYVIIIQSQFL